MASPNYNLDKSSDNKDREKFQFGKTPRFGEEDIKF